MADDIMTKVAEQFQSVNQKRDKLNGVLDIKRKELENLRVITFKKKAIIGEANKQIEIMKSELAKMNETEGAVVKLNKENKRLVSEIREGKKKVRELCSDLRKLPISPPNVANLKLLANAQDGSDNEEVTSAPANLREAKIEKKRASEEKIEKMQADIKRLEDELNKSLEENRLMENKHKNLRAEIEKTTNEIKDKAEENKKLSEMIAQSELELEKRFQETVKKEELDIDFDQEKINPANDNSKIIQEVNESAEVDNKVIFYQQKIVELEAKIKEADDEYKEM